jgi:geranylgeranyl transferase type-2 subunit beta
VDKQQTDNLFYWMSEHLRLNGVYWGYTALHLMGRPDALNRDDVIEYVKRCQHPSGNDIFIKKKTM